jgi:hypothetical protein
MALVVGLALLTGPLSAQTPLDVTGLSETAPLTVTASATESELIVDVALESEWHLYGRDVGGGRPVSVAIDEGGAFAAAGPLDCPMDERGEIAGNARLVLPIERIAPGTGLHAVFSLQVCDALQCLEPMQVELSGDVAPVSLLLVVAERDDRAQRIEEWLRSRDFEVDVATYADVTLEACDASDVVVADSDYFGRHGVDRELMRAFPRTSAPIVAVGFIGTELVEAHGVAMTSGYI